ncbi:sigma-54 dependent transcriptional regulator [bacterium]|nr:sigma-54 dependent transcriptional regulator [bacterium]
MSENSKHKEAGQASSSENISLNWKRVENLRVTRKLVNALKNLEIKSLYLVPANRRKDARKKYLGYGTKKMMFEAEINFVLDEKSKLIEKIKSNPTAWNDYKNDCIETLSEALIAEDTVVKEDSLGFIQMACGVRIKDEVVGVLRCDGIVSGKPNDLTNAKIFEQLSSLKIDQKEFKALVKTLPFFTSEKVAVVSNVLTMLSEEIGSFLEESVKENESTADSGQHNHSGLITRNPMILEIIRQIKLIGSSDSSVIIYGESGTGKELIANLIHKNSTRQNKPFVTINCAALTETILEAELFGYKKGAFTGAGADKKGLFEVADKGTIFLDEVGEMSLSLQVKILRLIQEGTFMRVGDTQMRKVDVKVVSATHRDLRQMIELGKFREDLYYRLAVVELSLPPLRDRQKDIPILVNHFLQEFQKKTQKSEITLSSETLKVLEEYYWPGNVREMRNEIERLVALNPSNSMIKTKDLSKKFFYESHPESMLVSNENEEGFIKKLVDDFERNLLLKYLRKHKWNKTQVAKLCGITRQGLNKKISKYNLDRRKF